MDAFGALHKIDFVDKNTKIGDTAPLPRRCTIGNCTRQRVSHLMSIQDLFQVKFINHQHRRRCYCCRIINNSAFSDSIIFSEFINFFLRSVSLCPSFSFCRAASLNQCTFSACDRSRARAKLILMTNFIVIFVDANGVRLSRINRKTEYILRRDETLKRKWCRGHNEL